MDVFALRDALIADYARYIDSFVRIRDARVRAKVEKELAVGRLWPEPLIQMNPSFASGSSVEELVATGVLHPAAAQIFRIKPDPRSAGRPLGLYRHQDSHVLPTMQERAAETVGALLFGEVECPREVTVKYYASDAKAASTSEAAFLRTIRK